MNYGYRRHVDLDVETAIDRVTTTLSGQGFGVLTTINVQSTLKAKLDVDRRPYVILGACNPELAHRGLEAEIDLGLLLPCNVIVYADDNDQTVVAAVDAGAMLAVVGNAALGPVAEDANAKLRAAIDAV